MNISRIFDVDDSRFKGMKHDELLPLIAAQDNDALAFVMKNYYQYVYSALTRYGWGDADAEELAQDTFVSLSKTAKQIMVSRPNWTLGSMLKTIALRIGLRRQNHMQRHRRRGKTVSMDEMIEGKDGRETRPRYIVKDTRPLQDSTFLVQEIISLIPERCRDGAMQLVFDEIPRRELNQTSDLSHWKIQTQLGKLFGSVTHTEPRLKYQKIDYKKIGETFAQNGGNLHKAMEAGGFSASCARRGLSRMSAEGREIYEQAAAAMGCVTFVPRPGRKPSQRVRREKQAAIRSTAAIRKAAAIQESATIQEPAPANIPAPEVQPVLATVLAMPEVQPAIVTVETERTSIVASMQTALFKKLQAYQEKAFNACAATDEALRFKPKSTKEEVSNGAVQAQGAR